MTTYAPAPDRTTRVVFEGRTHDIPDLWLAGQRAAGYSLLVSVANWHVQTVLAEREANR